MSTMNPFANNPAFSLFSLSLSMEQYPNMYGRVGELGLFRSQGVTTRTVGIEVRNGVLTLLPILPPGSPGSLGRQGKRAIRDFRIPHVPHDDAVLPDEVQDKRAFGTENGTDTVIEVVNQKLATMRRKHDITTEWHRVGALKGVVLDADGDVVYDYRTEFGVTQIEVDFELSTTSTDVRKKCAEVVRAIEKNLLGEVMSGVRALVSEEFYDALVSHPNVVEAFKYFQQTQNLSGDFRRGFTFGGITFEEYSGSAVNADGVVHQFIESETGVAFPLGTLSTFVEYLAPADFVETVNTMGRPYYAKIEPTKFGRGYELHTQSNRLPICTRPRLVIKLKKSS